MKVKDIVKQFGIDRDRFEEYIRQAKIEYKENTFTSEIASINDGQDINTLITDFKQYESDLQRDKVLKEKEADQERARQEKAALDKKEALANILITSGFNFDGYTITKYSGYISGDDAVQVERGRSFLGYGGKNMGEGLMASLVVIRRNALAELKEAAYTLGCNAVIGVDFDYITLDPQTHDVLAGGTTYQPYVFGVTANGNAVIIEKNKTIENKI
ncbi:MAG: heavy metal-binding domain-containing protein [Clostridia bacterium]|nr:heavy metal-binding domain-containing protein [Clostridia bacterium]